MDKFDVGLSKQFADREAQRFLPSGVEKLEEAIEPRDAKQVQRKGEKGLQVLPGRQGFKAGGLVAWPWSVHRAEPPF